MSVLLQSAEDERIEHLARIRAYSVMDDHEIAKRLRDWADGLEGEYLPLLLKEAANRLDQYAQRQHAHRALDAARGQASGEVYREGSQSGEVGGGVREEGSSRPGEIGGGGSTGGGV
jgi:uncharacterized protein with von Willebrand factor type A (vWA) domain